jgi:hypothetical protein
MQFKKWLILTESKEEKALALELAGDINILNQLQAVIKPKDKNIVDKLLLLAAGYYNQTKNLEQIKTDIQDYVHLLNNKKMNLIKVDPTTKKPDTDYLSWTQTIHGHHGEEAVKQRKSYSPTEVDMQGEEPIASSPDGRIKVYASNSSQQCIILGKGKSFCISQPGNTMFHSYRNTKNSTFYFVKDSSRNDELSTVVVDINKMGPELTDVTNTTGTTHDPFTGERTNDTKPYFKYLQDNGINTSIFKNIPKTQAEEEEQKKLGHVNQMLEWFKNLSHEEKSKYIGRGHVLANDQFDYLWDNKFYSLLEQYVKTGLRLNDYQLDKVASNSDLRKNYTHNRIAAQEHRSDMSKKEWGILNDQQKKDTVSKFSKEKVVKFLAELGELEMLKKEVENGAVVSDWDYPQNPTAEIKKYLDFKSGIDSDEAIYRDDFDELKKIVDNGGGIGSRAVEYSVVGNNLDMVKYLVEKGGRISDSAVDNASETGNLDMVKYLVKKGGKIGDYAVGNAASKNNFNMVKYLVDKLYKSLDDYQEIGRRNMIKSKIGSRPITNAAQHGNLDMIKYLLSVGGTIDKDAVLNAIENKHINVLKYLVEEHKKEMPEYALPIALEAGDEEIIDFVIKHLNIDDSGFVHYLVHILKEKHMKGAGNQFVNALDKILANKEIRDFMVVAMPFMNDVAKNREIYDAIIKKLGI